MNISTVFLAVFLAFAFASEVSLADEVGIDDLRTVSRRPRPCGSQCKFRMCNFNGATIQLPLAPFSILGAVTTAALPHVCRHDDDMGLVLNSGQAQVKVGNRFVPISAWRPRGLRRRFPPFFIRTYKVPGLPNSGIGRLTSTANQWSFLHDRCMILPITRYQRINPATGEVITIVRKSGPNECVAFRTTAPAIHVEVNWDTQDDFDLQVEEPGGAVLSHLNKRTRYGRLTGDNNAGFCGTALLFGRENVVYFPNPNIPRGRYKVRLIHYTKCASRPTNWNIKVVKNGVLIDTERGFSGVGEQKTVGTTEFTWP